MTKPKILLLNASRGGTAGNTAVLLDHLARHLKKKAHIQFCSLLETTPEEVLKLLQQVDALVIGTGTYWDSWSSSLQALLEAATPTEGTGLWLGKPAAVIVTHHSVGGKGVLSRLQGVLNTFGCLIPPMSGLVYSPLNQNILTTNLPLKEDVWCPDDLRILGHNLLAAIPAPKTKYQAWPVERKNPQIRWIET